MYREKETGMSVRDIWIREGKVQSCIALLCEVHRSEGDGKIGTDGIHIIPKRLQRKEE